MSLLTLLSIVWVVAALLMIGMWWQQVRSANASLVDVAWTGATGAAALFCALAGGGDPLRRTLLAVLAGVWSLRLAWFVFRRVWGEAEDSRYRALRAHWPGQLKWFLFYQAQAVAVLLFAVPFAVAASGSAPLPGWAAAGAILIWLVAVGGETLADRQLAAWKAAPANRGRTCRSGLWRYSRHPNYFFEWLHWFSYPLLAWGAEGWWLTLLGPLVMLLALFVVTGIPHTERQALASRGEDYRAYQRSTSVFVPWFPDLDQDRHRS